MESSEKGVDIQFTEKALTFIMTRRLKDPLVMVNLGYRTAGGDSSGCSGGGGCGGGEGESNSTIPYINIVIVDGGSPGDDFVKIDTQAGIPVYLTKAVLKKVKGSGNPLFIDLKGMVMKRFTLEGLDFGGTTGQSQSRGGGC